MLSQLSYGGFDIAEKDCCAVGRVLWVGIGKQDATQDGQRRTGCDERAMGLTIGISIYIYMYIYILPNVAQGGSVEYEGKIQIPSRDKSPNL